MNHRDYSGQYTRSPHSRQRHHQQQHIPTVVNLRAQNPHYSDPGDQDSRQFANRRQYQFVQDEPDPDREKVDFQPQSSWHNPERQRHYDDHFKRQRDSDEHFERQRDFDENFERPRDFDEHVERPRDSDEHFERQRDFDENFERQRDFDEHFERPRDFDEHFERPRDSDEHFKRQRDFDEPFERPRDFDEHFERQRDFDEHFEKQRNVYEHFERQRDFDDRNKGFAKHRDNEGEYSVSFHPHKIERIGSFRSTEEYSPHTRYDHSTFFNRGSNLITCGQNSARSIGSPNRSFERRMRSPQGQTTRNKRSPLKGSPSKCLETRVRLPQKQNMRGSPHIPLRKSQSPGKKIGVVIKRRNPQVAPKKSKTPVSNSDLLTSVTIDIPEEQDYYGAVTGLSPDKLRDPVLKLEVSVHVDSVPEDIEDRVPEVIEEKVPKLFEEKVPKVIEEKVAEDFEENVPESIQEKVRDNEEIPYVKRDIDTMSLKINNKTEIVSSIENISKNTQNNAAKIRPQISEEKKSCLEEKTAVPRELEEDQDIKDITKDMEKISTQTTANRSVSPEMKAEVISTIIEQNQEAEYVTKDTERTCTQISSSTGSHGTKSEMKSKAMQEYLKPQNVSTNIDTISQSFSQKKTVVPTVTEDNLALPNVRRKLSQPKVDRGKLKIAFNYTTGAFEAVYFDDACKENTCSDFKSRETVASKQEIQQDSDKIKAGKGDDSPVDDLFNDESINKQIEESERSIVNMQDTFKKLKLPDDEPENQNVALDADIQNVDEDKIEDKVKKAHEEDTSSIVTIEEMQDCNKEMIIDNQTSIAVDKKETNVNVKTHNVEEAKVEGDNAETIGDIQFKPTPEQLTNNLTKIELTDAVSYIAEDFCNDEKGTMQKTEIGFEEGVCALSVVYDSISENNTGVRLAQDNYDQTRSDGHDSDTDLRKEDVKLDRMKDSTTNKLITVQPDSEVKTPEKHSTSDPGPKVALDKEDLISKFGLQMVRIQLGTRCESPKLVTSQAVKSNNSPKITKLDSRNDSPKIIKSLLEYEDFAIKSKSPKLDVSIDKHGSHLESPRLNRILRVQLGERCDSPEFKAKRDGLINTLTKEGVHERSFGERKSDFTHKYESSIVKKLESDFKGGESSEEKMDEDDSGTVATHKRSLSERFSEYSGGDGDGLEVDMETDEPMDIHKTEASESPPLGVRLSLSERFSLIENKGEDASQPHIDAIENDKEDNVNGDKNQIKTVSIGCARSEQTIDTFACGDTIEKNNVKGKDDTDKAVNDIVSARPETEDDPDKAVNDIVSARPETEDDPDKKLDNKDKYNSDAEENVERTVAYKKCQGFPKEAQTSGRQKSPASPTSFLDYDDDDDDDDDDSDDDDLLDTAPAFLRSVQEITERPLPATPEKDFNCSQGSLSSSINETSLEYHSPLDPRRREHPKPSTKHSKFTLDGLLAEHTDNMDHDREMNEINTELKNDLKQGGFVNILNREEEAHEDFPLHEDQQQMLRHYHNQASQISDERPGTLIFHPEHYQCLFDENLHPTHCGFTAGGSTTIEKHLETVNTDQYMKLLTSGIIQMCFNKITCQGAVLRWLFYLMSVHRNYSVRQGCQQVLLAVLRKQQEQGQPKWTPRLRDIISVFVNYGVDLETLIPPGLASTDIIRQKLQHQPNHEAPPPHINNNGYQKENLALVLQIMAQSLYGNSGRHSASDLTLLLATLLKASLDTALKHLFAVDVFQNCIAMVVKQYSDTDWQKESLHMCRVIAGLADQHQNRAHVAQLLPPGTRGTYIQRRVSYLVLHGILTDSTPVSDDNLHNLQIRNLYQFVPLMKDLLIKDPYKLSSVVTLLDLCVGVNHTLKASEREELKILVEQVKRLRVRDNVSMLDRTRVKDMMVRVTSNWLLDIQTMKGKQTKIFEYTVHSNSPIKIKIETIKANISDDDSSDSSQSEDEDGTPRKLPKLTPHR